MLGDRPYPMKDNIKEYLQEQMERIDEDDFDEGEDEEE